MKAGKVSAIVASVAGEQAVGLVGGVATDEEIRDDVLPPRQGRLAGGTAERGATAAPRTLHLLASAQGVTLPSGSRLEEGIGGEMLDAEWEILDELGELILMGEAGGQLRVDHGANHHRP